MTDANQVYNSHFLLWQEGHPDFPDGWAQTGGDRATRWEWVGLPDGPRAIKIEHPSGPRAGIILESNVVIPAGEGQRWEFRVVLQTEPAETPCYIRVYLGAVSQYLLTLRPGSEPEDYSRVFSTPNGVTGIRVEVGILGEGVVTIHKIQGWRLYPKRELRLDEKGQLYVRHIDSIGKIQAPVSVRLVSPIPIPVDVRTPLQVKMSGRRYLQSVESVTSSNISLATMPKDVSELSAYSYAVHNNGTDEVVVQLQISPDGATWTADDIEHVVLPGALTVFTPNHFLRYVRIIYRSQLPNPLMVWFQAQG
ncbi:DUF6385 domain-containing protein [Desulfosporosinus sp.]|uniref:DUF6385 domain-containing protein n=1 Tax=Desulfosporosinus sp. TaxID=157907 RepID=UPI0025BCE892|nr:DUF6385 domain-containing protein [Desulfosporosinus sp.]MBC2723738.1 hypothetical protein [Desulfosporosinus sp.]MBC2728590.1 hypothetical protein [Desulfosporosinus sp.]